MRNLGIKDFSLIKIKFEKEFIEENALRHRKVRTVQHFCSSGLQKCCIVPKFLVPRRKNLGTVQHFFVSGLQKCCTVPNFFGFSLKSAVLSLKNLKNLFSRTFRASQA